MKSAWRSPGAGAALILLVTVLTYLPTLRAGFVFDDFELITGNPLIKAGDGLYRFWCTTEPADYYPLTWSLWWIEWRFWGNNATGYHAINILLHAVNAILVWLILRRLEIPGAWLAGLVFAVHPVNVATVAWVSEQKNTLSMLFYALSILLYVRFDEENHPPQTSSGGWRWYGLSLGAFLLALLSKTAVVMLPVVLLGCVWWKHGRVRWKDLLHSAPFFVCSLVAGLLTIWFQHHRALEGQVVRTDGFASRLALAGWVLWFYLYKAVLPFHLSMVYPKWSVDASLWVSYLPDIALVGGLAFLAWTRQPWARPVLFGLGYFVVTLFPVWGFFDQGFYLYSLVADHWQYYSIVGIIALAIAGGEKICRRLGERRRSWGTVTGAALVMALGLAAWSRSHVYASNETLWRNAVSETPGAFIARFNWGVALQQAGRIQEAMPQLERAVELKPDSAEAHYNLGDVLVRSGRVTEGIAHFEQAIRLKPDFVEAHNNLGSALLRLGRLQEAIQQWEETLRIKPDFAEAHINLGNTLAQMGRLDEAVEQYRQALRIKPNAPDAYYNLGNVLVRMGRVPDGIACYEQALRIGPDSAAAHNALGNALVRSGRAPEAPGQYEQALQIDPDFAEAHNNWGATLVRLGKVQEAIEHWEQALRIKPDYADAHRNLGDTFLRLGRVPEAIDHYKQVLRVNSSDPRVHCNLGNALEQAGKLPEAIGEYEWALRLKPDYAEAQRRLDSLQARQAQPRTVP